MFRSDASTLRSRLALFCFALLAATTLSGSAGAFDVFVNGVRVTGSLKSVVFKGCTVEFDVAGNLLITAPGYKIISEDPNATKGPSTGQPIKPPPQPAKLDNRYVLYYKANGNSHYSFEVYLNGELFREIKPTEASFGVEITERLRKGSNIVRIVARRDPKAPATNATDKAKVLIAQGNEGKDGTFQASKVHWELTRTGKDRDIVDETRGIEAK